MAQGIDGLSKGQLAEGVMRGLTMQEFLPIHLHAFEQSEKLLTWIRAWTRNPHLTPILPEDWFGKGQEISGGSKGIDGL
eukprot:14690469-Ditylum_brightwellii.AAC.1